MPLVRFASRLPWCAACHRKRTRRPGLMPLGARRSSVGSVSWCSNSRSTLHAPPQYLSQGNRERDAPSKLHLFSRKEPSAASRYSSVEAPSWRSSKAAPNRLQPSAPDARPRTTRSGAAATPRGRIVEIYGPEPDRRATFARSMCELAFVAAISGARCASGAERPDVVESKRCRTLPDRPRRSERVSQRSLTLVLRCQVD